ncbi:cytochrome P450 [Periconia macrospinosa]|uniref:Cytochrome P450 n=1 Tax=Periconia macrospinosa TaxID=97972 RepID=A0A2V1D5U2_9PLEO|nr:cytochrome P450 [Periconia macrospinosa]
MALSTRAISLPDLFLITFVLIFCILFANRVYARHFHPLARIPGPFFGRMSPWPSALHAWRGDRHLWLEECFKKYGNKIRVAPNTVIFRSPTAFQDIYSSRANVRRADFYNALKRTDEETSTITTIDNTLHAKRRRLLDLVFTGNSLREAAYFMQRHIDRWHELLIAGGGGDDWTPPTNFTDRANELVFDILGDVCFGRSFKTMEPEDNALKAVPRAAVKTLTVLNAIAKTPFIHLIIYLRPRGLARVFRAIRPATVVFFDEFVETSIRKRVEREQQSERFGEPRRDMFHFVYHARDSETGEPAFRGDQLVAECRLLLVAGSDSTSVTMTGLFFYLSHYPEALDKLRAEITGKFLLAEDIHPGPGLTSCKYLRAAIDEAMRMSPAGLCELQRQVLPGGIMIDGDYFPENTVVGTAAWCDAYNDEVYGDAAIYRPERWLSEDAERIKANFHPFGIGPHNCAGTNFALQELLLMVAKTVHRFEFRLSPEWAKGAGMRHRRRVGDKHVPHFHLRDAYITVRDGPVLQFRKRLSAGTAPHQ